MYPSTAQESDEAIVSAVQNGDIDAFGALVERYEPKLLRYAKKFLFDVEDRKDILQEVFLKAYQNINDFDVARKFSPWIYRIAHNEFVNALKKRQRAPLLFFDPDLLFPQFSSPETADRTAIDEETKRAIDAHIGDLDAKYREPIVLFFYEELGYKEIAEVLQIPAATVGVRISRAKALLKKMINKETL